VLVVRPAARRSAQRPRKRPLVLLAPTTSTGASAYQRKRVRPPHGLYANLPSRGGLIYNFSIPGKDSLSASLDLRRLRYFVAVAEELHFGRAAQRLHVAQPALSMQIRKLEHELGVALFTRARGMPVSLTEPGALLLDEARRLLDRAGRLGTTARRAARGEIGHVEAGFVPSIAVTLLPAVVGAMRRQFPDIYLGLTELGSDDIADAIRADNLDVGLVRPPLNTSGIKLEVVWVEDLVAALPSAHPLARRQRLSFKALAQEPLVISTRAGSPSWHEDIFALYRRYGLSARIGQEVSTLPAQLGLVSAGVGIALLPRCVTAMQIPGVILQPVTGTPKLQLLVATRNGPPGPALQNFLDCIRQAAESLRDQYQRGVGLNSGRSSRPGRAHQHQSVLAHAAQAGDLLAGEAHLVRAEPRPRRRRDNDPAVVGGKTTRGAPAARRKNPAADPAQGS
jgi:DNA-binding transcriptional LysR family regulator